MALKSCPNGHQYHKSSDCPSCPICEAERKPRDGFMALLGAPARRAMESHNINSLEQLAGYSEQEILQFHGVGKSSIPKLKQALLAAGLDFRK